MQDEPEHLRTIRDRLLRNEQCAGRLLGIYQQILQGIKVPTDDSKEQIELCLSGLVVKYQGFLQVKNRIYEQIFNLEWVEKQLNLLRPYAYAIEAWIAANQMDDSRLLRGKSLKDAQAWAWDKTISDLDYQFLAKSEELDRLEEQKALEAARLKEVEARLKEERKRLTQQQKSHKLLKFLVFGMAVKFMLATVWCIFFYCLSHKATTSEIQARINEIEALTLLSQTQYQANQRTEALVEAIKAKQKLQQLSQSDVETRQKVDTTLTQAINGVAENYHLIRDSRKNNELAKACNWVRDYLQINAKLASNDAIIKTLGNRHLCNVIKFSQKDSLL